MLAIGFMILMYVGYILSLIDRDRPYKPPIPSSTQYTIPQKKPATSTVIPINIAEDIVTDDVPLCESPIVYKNIAAKHPTPLYWFLCPHPDLPAPSPAEALIIEQLELYKVRWYREVSFYGLQVKKGSHPRYDIWIPSKMLILEYDGSAYHQSAHNKAMDKLKNKFCKDHGITIIRWNKSHYYHIPERVASLMEMYDITRK
jgi:hypothetical protein